jgi:hypothetical protein
LETSIDLTVIPSLALRYPAMTHGGIIYIYIYIRFHDSALCEAVQPGTRLVQCRRLCQGNRYLVSPFGVAFRGTDCVRKARDGCIKILLVAYDAVWFSRCQGCGGKRHLNFQSRRDIGYGSSASFPSVHNMKIHVVTSRNILNFIAAKFIKKMSRSGLDQD